MKKRHMLIAAMAAALCISAPLSANAADSAPDGTWQSNATGWWYQTGENAYLTSGFYDIADETGAMQTYYFDAQGYMAKGWQKINGSWYLFENNGSLVKGWKQIGGKWYYLDEYDGRMYENTTTTIDDVKYHFTESGAMVSGWVYDNGDWYCADASGALKTGWLYDGGLWYYLNQYSGYMYANGSYDVSNGDGTTTKYYFKENGQMVTGWYNYGDAYDTYGDWVYCNADGSVYTGWIASGANWYYVDEGDMATSSWINSYADEAKTQWTNSYYVGKDGAMVKGWYHSEYKDDEGYYSDNWIYTNPADGSYYTGWVQSGGKWYYINKSGYMVRGGTVLTGTAPKAPAYPNYTDYLNADGTTNWDAYDAARDEYYVAYDKYQEEDRAYRKNNTYVFDASGAMVTGWYAFHSTNGTTWYYADPSGVGHDGWLYDGGHWYYISRGTMLTNAWTEDGYYVGANGVWQ